MGTASGVQCQTTGPYGSRHEWQPVGRHIGMAIGPGFTRGDGPGSMMRHGDLGPSTTGVGLLSAELGLGYLVPISPGPFTRQPWSRSSGMDNGPCRSAVAAASPGSRLDLAKCLFPLIAPAPSM